VVLATRPVVVCITDEFYSKQFSIYDRLTMLDALVEAAMQMNGWKKKGNSLPLLLLLLLLLTLQCLKAIKLWDRADTPHAASAVLQLGTVTRKMHQHVERETATPNRFFPYLALFFFSIIRCVCMYVCVCVCVSECE